MRSARRNVFTATALKVLCTVLLLFHHSLPSTGQVADPSPRLDTYLWKPVKIGGGGFITGFEADPTGKTRVIRSDVYGAYLWRGDSDRWVQLVTSSSMPASLVTQNGANEGVFEVAIAPNDACRVFIALKGNIYRSDNCGKNFLLSSHAHPFPVKLDPNSRFRFQGPFMLVSPWDRDLIFLGTPYDGLLRSHDGGENWDVVASLPKPVGWDQAAVAPIKVWVRGKNEGKLVAEIWAASDGNGMYTSRDGGLSFQPLAAGGDEPKQISRGRFAADGSFYAADPDCRCVWMYRSEKWHNLTRSSNLPEKAFVAVAINNDDSYMIAIDEGGESYISMDLGASWVGLLRNFRANEKEPPWLSIVSRENYFATAQVAFDPIIRNRLWLAGGTGLYFADVKDSSFELSWESQIRGVEDLVSNDVVQTPNHPPLFAAQDFGIHRKDDLDRFSSTYGPRERVIIAAQQLATTPADANFVATNASDTRLFCCELDSVLAGYSEDGGRTWKQFETLPTPAGLTQTGARAMSFGTIAISSNDPDNIIWEPSFNLAAQYTRDRGRTWKPITLGRTSSPLSGSHSNYFEQRKTLVADPVAPNTFYLAHSGSDKHPELAGLWSTGNGGASWSKKYAGEIAPNSRHAAKLRAVPGRQGYLFFTAGVQGIPDSHLRRSLDGGATWSLVPNVDSVDDIAFGKAKEKAPYPTIFLSGRVAGTFGIWRSTDNAESWHRVGRFPLGLLDQVTVLGADPDYFGRVYVGFLGSGWVYGEPTSCVVGGETLASNSECTAVP